ncbi:MAG: glycerate kinase [Bacteroidales bacterium]|nr:glycerate kinase [Bacteroidales bacterium]
MKILLALDSFKGSLTAREAVEAAASALDGDIVRLPLSDGGEGFTECMVEALGGVFRTVRVHDPLGRQVNARYGLVQGGRTAVIETAAAGGLTLLNPSELDPWNASSFGVGEMILDAVNQDVEEICIGLGGTAVMDGGSGMLDAVGTLPAPIRIHAFFDADVPLTGPRGAAYVFGPQKGADAEMVLRLDKRFRDLSRSWKDQYGVDADKIPGAGAAGGIGAALGVCLRAQMHPGIDSVLDAVGFGGRLDGSDLVITGEGKADLQTLTGKVPYGVLRQVRRLSADIPVILVAGRVEDKAALLEAGFTDVIRITPENEFDGKGMEKEVAAGNLKRAVQDLQHLRNQH